MSLIPDEASQSKDSSSDSSQDPNGRPDFVEQQFWDADGGKVRVKEMAQALSDTQTKLRNQKESLRKEIESEIMNRRPESPAAYKVENLDIPEGSDFSIPDGDPLIERFRSFAFDAGLDNKQFEQAVSLYAQTLLEGIPNPGEEIKALGENAQVRIDTLVTKAKGVLDDDEFSAFQKMAMTAKDVQVLEKLMLQRQQGPSSFDAVEPNALDLEAERDKIMTSPEYLRGDHVMNKKALEISMRLAKMQGRA